MIVEKPGTAFRAADLPAGRTAVMFGADWCGFSRRFLQHYRRIGGAWLVDISDEDDPLWDDLRIDVVPTVILFENGAPRRRWAGVLGERHVAEIEAALSGPPSSLGL